MLDDSVIQLSGRNILFQEELKYVLSVFAKHGIKVIVLKGAAFAESIYEHIGQRKMGDIDLLVKEKDKKKAGDVLIKEGYHLLEKSQSFYIKEGKMGALIDLDHKMPYINDENALWESAVPFNPLTANAFVLSIEENMIYLCYHMLIGHGRAEEKWIKDIDKFIRFYEKNINWDYFARRVKIYKLYIPCYFTLKRVKDHFGTPVPNDVLSRIKCRNTLKAKIFRLILKSKNPAAHITYFLYVLMHPRLFFSWGFPSRKFMRTRYQVKPPFLYIYYLLRPLRLIIEGINALWRLISIKWFKK